MTERVAGQPKPQSRCYEPPTAALREGSVARLESELGAYLARAGGALARDWRDVLVILATYHDCALRLGSDPIQVFDKAAADKPVATRTVAMQFARRTDITLEAFGWVLTELPDGPCYESADHLTYDDLRAAIERMGGHITTSRRN
jgi:hypothetical protein